MTTLWVMLGVIVALVLMVVGVLVYAGMTQIALEDDEDDFHE